ncbi:c-type cytochrome [Nitrosomonas sp. Is37]|uniref:c-type cytochrome n=1 Tax=Nitrosomonas sp. Is37 TaxID=3080535 RepID=UPI00294AEF2E|nr:c-type cytochrome [Nitrosomonas sp. Is37]MDV6344026.1 c-type cytochrome [Nitrosomonas sp. Is37]
MLHFILIIFLLITFAANAAQSVPDTIAERVKVCTVCHDDKDKMGRHAYYPRISGKPQGYLFNQLRNFRDGLRHYQPMAILLENMSDAYLQEIAHYFSTLQPPFPPPEPITMQADEVEMAKQLIHSGHAARDIPACSACHGDTLMGVKPFVPGLLGLSRAYLTAQFGSWRNGGLMRGQTSDCMSKIAQKLTDKEVNTIAKWLATQPASGKPNSITALSSELTHRCSSVLLEEETNNEALNPSPAEQQQIRGAYLTRAGNCMGCHTAPGGLPFAGGRRLSTSFGTFVTPNITPDKKTGIGYWSEEDFWQALHQGKSPDGRLLYPAFPYTEYTKVTREDANAIFAYLQSLPTVSQVNPPSEIRFPYNFRPLLVIWRALYFKAGVYASDQSKNEEWNRGAYLVQGLGHCNACHTSRNLLGASEDDTLTGGRIIGANWYAPSLISNLEAGSGHWTIEEISELLATGVSKRAMASGPMATIIRQNLQHLSSEDIRAVAVYLKSIAENERDDTARTHTPVNSAERWEQFVQGGQLYEKYCQDCHGTSGEGVPGVYPPLAGNRSVIMASPLNTIRSVLNGGYPATTSANPRPYGMPPFQQILREEEVALIVSFIRNAWGNKGSWVTTVDIDRSKESVN